MDVVNVKTSELEVGDILIGWRDDRGQVERYEDCTYVITEVDGDIVYYDTLEFPEYKTRVLYENNLVWAVRRGPKREPCIKCGKSLHPGLSSLAGVTHDC